MIGDWFLSCVVERDSLLPEALLEKEVGHFGCKFMYRYGL